MAYTEVTPSRLAARGVARRYFDVELDQLEYEKDVAASLAAFCKNIGANLAAGKGLFLYGPNGTGKTSAAVCVIKAAMRAGYVAQMYPWPTLLADHTAGWRDPDARSAFLEATHHVDLLVIDDLGKELGAGKELSVSVLDSILRYRSSAMRSTILTTNAVVAQIREVYGSSVASLLNGSVEQLLIEGEDRR